MTRVSRRVRKVIRVSRPACFGTFLRVVIPQPLNATVVEEHDVQHINAGAKVEVETKVLVIDEEESDDDSDVVVIVSEETEEPVRQPTLMTADYLQALIESLKDTVGNTPSVPLPETEVHGEDDATKDSIQASNKRQGTETTLDTYQAGPSTEPEPTMHSDPPITAATQKKKAHKTSILIFEFDLPETTSQSQPESSSDVRFDVAMRFAANKMKFIEEGDSDDDMDADVAKLQRSVIVLEQDAALKEAQISSLQAQISSKDQTIKQLQVYVNMLMSVVYDLKAKLEKKFGNEFVDKDDEQLNVGRQERATEERVVADVEHEAGLTLI
ncbi:hypothetical protein Hanom_Chr14g01277261 [Helianthus anomalus]